MINVLDNTYLPTAYTTCMGKKATGRIFSSGEANTLYTSIPSVVASDSAFPFEYGEEVEVKISDDKLIIESV